MCVCVSFGAGIMNLGCENEQLHDMVSVLSQCVQTTGFLRGDMRQMLLHVPLGL